MKMTRRTFTTALACSLAFAQDEEQLSNGVDLAGWKVREGPESAFYVADGAIVGSPASAYPAWLASARQYENFDLTFEFFLKGWMDGGLYIHAPEHGRPSTCGLKVNIFHAREEKPQINSMGSVFPLVAPSEANAHKPEWNTMRVLSDWPKLQVWINGDLVQDLKLDTHPELSRRLRRGRLGFTTIGYPLRFRNIRVKELPPKVQWQSLYTEPGDIAKWFISESNKRAPAQFHTYGKVLRADGLGNLATKERYRDFDLQMYVRGARHHNGGVLFRSDGKQKHYEIQLHDVPEAHFPTGSLYHHKRARYPDIRDEEWFLFQLLVQGPRCQVRIDGETVLEYDDLKETGPGHVELQAHDAGRWTEYKDILIRPL